MTFSKRKKRKKNSKKTQKVNDSCCIKVKKTSKTTKNDQKWPKMTLFDPKIRVFGPFLGHFWGHFLEGPDRPRPKPSKMSKYDQNPFKSMYQNHILPKMTKHEKTQKKGSKTGSKNRKKHRKKPKKPKKGSKTGFFHYFRETRRRESVKKRSFFTFFVNFWFGVNGVAYTFCQKKKHVFLRFFKNPVFVKCL